MLAHHRSIRWLVVLTFSAMALLISLALINTASAQGNGPQNPQAPSGSSFTYQGRLIKNGQPISDVCALSFSLWDASSGGSFLNSNTFNSVPISNGLFTVQIDYGANAFNGEARWIETAVRCTGDANYVTLSPRTKLTAAPYAIYSLNGWALNGNSGTNGNGFLGTTDNTTLTLGVSNTIALRLIPAASAPIVIGGYAGNAVNGLGDGAIIAGGGSSYLGANIISGTNVIWSTIGGGVNNQIAGNAYQSAIGGGRNNVISGTDAYRTTIGGGYYNFASGGYTTIGGGDGNFASGGSTTIGGGEVNFASGEYATIGGGRANTAAGYAATVPGGQGNAAVLSYALAAGHRAKANHQGTFVWADSTEADFASTSNNQFLIRANGGVGINTNDPLAAALAVQSNSTNTGNNTAQFSAPNIGPNPSHIHYGPTGDWYIRSAASTGKVILQDTGGLVGVNTTGPDRALDVNGVIGVFDGVQGLHAGLATEASSSLIEMGLNDDASNRFGGTYNFLLQGGLLRVDARDGQDLFQFYGRAPFGLLNLLASLNTSGVLMINGLGSGGSTSLCYNALHQIATCSSSRRYKNNVENLQLGLEAVARLRPITFNWKTDGKPDLGFVAEEVNQVSPLLTTSNQAGQIEGVKYDRISAVLVKAIQEQQQQIAELKAQNTAQQQELAQLKRSSATDQPSTLFNAISLIALGGVIVLGLRQKRGGHG